MARDKTERRLPAVRGDDVDDGDSVWSADATARPRSRTSWGDLEKRKVGPTSNERSKSLALGFAM